MLRFLPVQLFFPLERLDQSSLLPFPGVRARGEPAQLCPGRRPPDRADGKVSGGLLLARPQFGNLFSIKHICSA